jgi:hypothetical protein
MGFLKFLGWLFWPSWGCKHEPGHWEYHNMGMSKARYCKHCGKCLDLI